MTPSRVPRSGSQENRLRPFCRFSMLNTIGHSMKITWSRVTAKSCIIDGHATSITSLRTSAPLRSATWYWRYGGNGE